MPEEQIIAAVDGLDVLMNSCDLVDQARLIPDLLRATQQNAAEMGSPEAYRRVVVTAHAATFFMRNLGEVDLVWMAADRMRQAAEAAGDPATLALAAYTQAHSLTPSGALQRAATVSTSAADATVGTGPEELAAKGSCLLVSESTIATLGDVEGARDRLTEAAAIAERIDNSTLVARHTSFSDWNVIMHRVRRGGGVQLGRSGGGRATVDEYADRSSGADVVPGGGRRAGVLAVGPVPGALRDH